MKEIDKIHLIKREELSETCYVTSLINTAYSKGMISDNEKEEISKKVLELLIHRVKIFAGAENSSISTDMAENIMKSNLYTVGIYLKRFLPDEGIIKIVNESFMDMYDEGKKLIYRKIKVAKSLYYKVIKSKLFTENETYNLTIDGGISGFFRIYDPEFEAYNIKITADYPLYSNIIGKYEGIEFIEMYLQSICYENEVCNIFLPYDIESLLYRYSKEYKGLVINIFQLVLIECIGCVIGGEECSRLEVSSEALERIYSKMADKSRIELQDMILDMLRKMFGSNRKIMDYIECEINEITSIIYNAIRLKTLDKIFV